MILFIFFIIFLKIEEILNKSNQTIVLSPFEELNIDLFKKYPESKIKIINKKKESLFNFSITNKMEISSSNLFDKEEISLIIQTKTIFQQEKNFFLLILLKNKSFYNVEVGNKYNNQKLKIIFSLNLSKEIEECFDIYEIYVNELKLLILDCYKFENKKRIEIFIILKFLNPVQLELLSSIKNNLGEIPENCSRKFVITKDFLFRFCPYKFYLENRIKKKNNSIQVFKFLNPLDIKFFLNIDRKQFRSIISSDFQQISVYPYTTIDSFHLGVVNEHFISNSLLVLDYHLGLFVLNIQEDSKLTEEKIYFSNHTNNFFINFCYNYALKKFLLMIVNDKKKKNSIVFVDDNYLSGKFYFFISLKKFFPDCKLLFTNNLIIINFLNLNNEEECEIFRSTSKTDLSSIKLFDYFKFNFFGVVLNLNSNNFFIIASKNCTFKKLLIENYNLIIYSKNETAIIKKEILNLKIQYFTGYSIIKEWEIYLMPFKTMNLLFSPNNQSNVYEINEYIFQKIPFQIYGGPYNIYPKEIINNNFDIKINSFLNSSVFPKINQKLEIKSLDFFKIVSFTQNNFVKENLIGSEFTVFGIYEKEMLVTYECKKKYYANFILSEDTHCILSDKQNLSDSSSQFEFLKFDVLYSQNYFEFGKYPILIIDFLRKNYKNNKFSIVFIYLFRKALGELNYGGKFGSINCMGDCLNFQILFGVSKGSDELISNIIIVAYSNIQNGLFYYYGKSKSIIASNLELNFTRFHLKLQSQNLTVMDFILIKNAEKLKTGSFKIIIFDNRTLSLLYLLIKNSNEIIILSQKKIGQVLLGKDRYIPQNETIKLLNSGEYIIIIYEKNNKIICLKTIEFSNEIIFLKVLPIFKSVEILANGSTISNNYLYILVKFIGTNFYNYLIYDFIEESEKSLLTTLLTKNSHSCFYANLISLNLLKKQDLAIFTLLNGENHKISHLNIIQIQQNDLISFEEKKIINKSNAINFSVIFAAWPIFSNPYLNSTILIKAHYLMNISPQRNPKIIACENKIKLNSMKNKDQEFFLEIILNEDIFTGPVFKVELISTDLNKTIIFYDYINFESKINIVESDYSNVQKSSLYNVGLFKNQESILGFANNEFLIKNIYNQFKFLINTNEKGCKEVINLKLLNSNDMNPLGILFKKDSFMLICYKVDGSLGFTLSIFQNEFPNENPIWFTFPFNDYIKILSVSNFIIVYYSTKLKPYKYTFEIIEYSYFDDYPYINPYFKKKKILDNLNKTKVNISFIRDFDVIENCQEIILGIIDNKYLHFLIFNNSNFDLKFLFKYDFFLGNLIPDYQFINKIQLINSFDNLFILNNANNHAYEYNYEYNLNSKSINLKVRNIYEGIAGCKFDSSKKQTQIIRVSNKFIGRLCQSLENNLQTILIYKKNENDKTIKEINFIKFHSSSKIFHKVDELYQINDFCLWIW